MPSAATVTIQKPKSPTLKRVPPKFLGLRVKLPGDEDDLNAMLNEMSKAAVSVSVSVSVPVSDPVKSQGAS